MHRHPMLFHWPSGLAWTSWTSRAYPYIRFIRALSAPTICHVCVHPRSTQLPSARTLHSSRSYLSYSKLQLLFDPLTVSPLGQSMQWVWVGRDHLLLSLLICKLLRITFASLNPLLCSKQCSALIALEGSSQIEVDSVLQKIADCCYRSVARN